jgi:hypothetical protein
VNAILPSDFERLHGSEAGPQWLGRLWSLWDMSSNYAWQFFLLSEFVADIKGKLAPRPWSPAGNSLSALVSTPASAEDWLEAGDTETIQRRLTLLRQACEFIGIRSLSREIDRITAALASIKRGEC